ncbi:MAG TPA: AAA family ATPase [Steroidobacteraceae bacterium]|jgi:HTH-type transcriptional repressor of NAD biosynthesis genes|nr:AAA family ATPase [Steroidobacteraceae bacterium]
MSAEPQLPHCFALGLVVGKFSPLHLGHEWLIDQAARRCDRLLILSYANPELHRCEAPQRHLWLTSRFPDHETIVIDDEWLRQKCTARGVSARPLPANDSSDEVQQQFLAWLLESVLQRSPDAMFCSENYGPQCAATLTRSLGHTVEAVLVDLHRGRVPISARQIREDPHLQRHWLAPDVRASFIHRIAVLGGESSGKSSLTAALAAHFDTVWACEYGRELWDRQSGVLSESDLLKIAHEQIRREEAGLRLANRYLFCDTSPLTTAGYAGWMFGRVDPMLAALAKRDYDAVVLCRPDFPFVQDGTRRDEAFRLEQHRWYQKQIAQLRCPSLEAAGSVPDRVSSVAGWLSTLGLHS